MNLEDLRDDIAIRQKKGIPFIVASIILWSFIIVVVNLNLPIYYMNLLIFCCSCPLVPIAWGIGKILHIDIFDKSNPLGQVGFIFTLNQLIYLLIVMWVFNAVPGKMLMVYAMVFGGHLFPYSWLYKSISYKIFAIIVPLLALYIGSTFSPVVLAGTMLFVEIIFVVALLGEMKKLKHNAN
ncbi:DUF7010 family protein [Clostridium cellulovorans]|uniref:Uncharacterized protein n=1 Tax=Clostridium cellulovorans (strain ATCC 35296 / DSM 3052 / OCM 3 / 743B) TaxID=573061 RepID=D9SNW7_CLOC7|nr:hypothetical protein [Clostridium cellulovorans]ADL49988.1 hypothetical protein Clocel_0204 [Clostridium cellulovorans 743B]